MFHDDLTEWIWITIRDVCFILYLMMNPEFDVPGLNSRGITYPIWGLATCPNMPDKETSNGEGQREDYCTAWGTFEKRQSKHFNLSLAIFKVQIWALGLKRGRTGAGGKRYV
jgi:hypothetical protein